MQDRMKRPCLLSILILLLGTSAHGQTRYVAFPPNVFRISSDNQIEMVPLPSQGEVTDTEFGSSSPHVSPDNSWIAFTRNFDLCLYNTATGDIVRATHVGRPYSQTFASVEVLIVAWSADTSKLLINVIPGETECVDCNDRLDWKTRERKCLNCENRGDWKQRKASYGYFIYGLRERSLRKAILPSNFEVAAWLPNGRFLGMNTLDFSRHIRITTPSGELYSITDVDHVAQMDVSADGAEVLVTINEKENANDNESSSHLPSKPQQRQTHKAHSSRKLCRVPNAEDIARKEAECMGATSHAAVREGLAYVAIYIQNRCRWQTNSRVLRRLCFV